MRRIRYYAENSTHGSESIVPYHDDVYASQGVLIFSLAPALSIPLLLFYFIFYLFATLSEKKTRKNSKNGAAEEFIRSSVALDPSIYIYNLKRTGSIDDRR